MNLIVTAWSKFKQQLRPSKARTAKALDQAIPKGNAAAWFRSRGYRDTAPAVLL
jgi:hypothetical protein